MHIVDWLAESTDNLLNEAANIGEVSITCDAHQVWRVRVSDGEGNDAFARGSDLHDALAKVMHGYHTSPKAT